MNRVPLALAASLYLAACTQAPPPADPPPARPEQAQAAAADTHDDLRRAVQAPIDKAHAVEQTLQEDADATAKAIEDAGG